MCRYSLIWFILVNADLFEYLWIGPDPDQLISTFKYLTFAVASFKYVQRVIGTFDQLTESIKS